ncbi:MAG: hypothetical protein HYT62_02625 [Candidatus Yanofskybacteria bacterium]|nr:hypothetical protein [Candidatus Yanofskybacteria bacterium]
MSEYSLYDFTESMGQVDLSGLKLVSVIKAWGYSPEGYGSWEGGFVLHFGDGRYAYLSGWCDTTGWGCQDGVDIRFADSIEELALPTEYGNSWTDSKGLIAWDLYPADLNLWIEKGSPDPYSL